MNVTVPGQKGPIPERPIPERPTFLGVQKGPLLDTRKAYFDILSERSTNRIFYGININGSYKILDKAIYDSKHGLNSYCIHAKP